MLTVLLVCAGAALLAALLAPPVRDLARAFGLLDQPDPARKLHTRAVPRLGGVALLAAFHAAVGAWLLLAPAAPGAVEGLGGLLVGGALVAGLGLYDDLRWAGAPLKLTVQVAAALVAWQAGWRLEVVALPFLPPVALGPLALPATVLWLTLTTNALNLLDGLDGLAAGQAVLAAGALGAAAWLNGEGGLVVLLAALLGATAGVLPWNRHPASIFLGDSGSMALGFLLGAASLGAAAAAPGQVALLVPVVALALPLGDTLFAFVRRALAWKNPLKGDQGHLHHRLLAAGVGHAAAVRQLHLAALLLAVSAVALAALQAR